MQGFGCRFRVVSGDAMRDLQRLPYTLERPVLLRVAAMRAGLQAHIAGAAAKNWAGLVRGAQPRRWCVMRRAAGTRASA